MQVTLKDLVHTGPGTLAGRYLRSFWQPVLRSEDLLKGRSLPIRIMSEDFTVYRGESGKAFVVAARCAHRLTRLHTGWVEGDTIRCLYHGWQYDHTGQCIFQPGEREAFTKGTKIAAFPTTEYIGLIWAYFGEGEPPPMRRYPDFERPGLISTSPPEAWPCNYFNRLDNAPDLMHVLYTHKETMKREANVGSGTAAALTHPPTMQFIETDFGIETTFSAGPTNAYFHFLMPNTNAIAATVGRVEGYRDGARHWKAEMFIRVPVDDENSISFPIVFLDLHGDDATRYIESRDKARKELDPQQLIAANAEAVLQGKMRVADMDPRMNAYYSFLVEDYAGQVGQGPIADRENERLGQIDQGTVMLRQIWMRELKAFADGKPLKKWAVPPGLCDRTQPQPSWAARTKAEPAELVARES